MATFVVLGKFTEKSFESMKDPAMFEEVKKFAKDMGAEIKAWYMLMGQYDEMSILEAPDAETAVQGRYRLKREIWLPDRDSAGLQRSGSQENVPIPRISKSLPKIA